MNAYFGEPWGPINAGQEQVPTPVGVKCMSCVVPVQEGDAGIMMPFMGKTADGERVAMQNPYHRECLAHDTIGHVYGVCRCTGHDPVTPEERRADALEACRRMDAGKP